MLSKRLIKNYTIRCYTYGDDLSSNALNIHIYRFLFRHAFHFFNHMKKLFYKYFRPSTLKHVIIEGKKHTYFIKSSGKIVFYNIIILIDINLIETFRELCIIIYILRY